MALIQSDSGRLCGTNRAFEGERVSGDGLFYHEDEEGILLSISDGLGHGKGAHKVSSDISSFLESHHHKDIAALITQVHEKIAPCMGAAMAIAYINLKEGLVSFCGIGNVGGYLIGPRDKVFVCKDGMVGANMRSPLVQSETLSPGDKVILASDGIHERFYSKAKRHIFKEKPTLIVQYLLDEFSKPYDDASCWVFEY